MTPGAVARLLEPVKRRVLLAVGRAVLRAVDDAGGLQRVQVSLLGGETRDGVDRMQPYGLSAVPLAGADCVVVCVGGNRDNPVVVVADDRRHRPTGLAAGEVALYSHLAAAAGGHSVLLRQDQVVVVEAKQIILRATERVKVEAPALHVAGSILASGTITPGATVPP